MPGFNQRAESMNLETNLSYKGLFKYHDRYGEVIYRQLQTGQISEDPEGPHLTDGISIPLLGVFTRAIGADRYMYTGYVSNSYKFIGNDVLVSKIKESINAVGIPIIREELIQNYILTRMRTELIIRNGMNVLQIGDVLPVMVVNNSYDGSRAATVGFGITFPYSGRNLTFAFSLGEIRQIHLESSNTTMSSSIMSYMQAFSENIVDLISNNFTTQITLDHMLSILDVIEGIGKKKREQISKLLEEMQPGTEEGQEPPLPTVWQVFLAIVRYSSLEPNLNAKRLLENAAESVLVIPVRMQEVLNQLQT